jgi:hypothetical protein
MNEVITAVPYVTLWSAKGKFYFSTKPSMCFSPFHMHAVCPTNPILLGAIFLITYQEEL